MSVWFLFYSYFLCPLIFQIASLRFPKYFYMFRVAVTCTTVTENSTEWYHYTLRQSMQRAQMRAPSLFINRWQQWSFDTMWFAVISQRSLLCAKLLGLSLSFKVAVSHNALQHTEHWLDRLYCRSSKAGQEWKRDSETGTGVKNNNLLLIMLYALIQGCQEPTVYHVLSGVCGCCAKLL